MRTLVFMLVALVLLVVLASAAAAWTGWWYARQPLKVATGAAEFTISRGAGMRQTSEAIARAGVRMDPRLFTLLARTTGHAQKIKAGVYEIKAGITPLELLRKLEAGETAQGAVLLVEGWTFRQVRAALEKHPDLLHDTEGLTDARILEQIGASETQPEGLFFPDTYVFDKHSSALDVLARAYKAMQAKLSAEWTDRARELPLKSPYEALILASIVEKETGRAEDRSRIANVFINRLRFKWRLETDPTVIYGMGDKYKGTLLRRDLEVDTPWNTYTREGLPPTPIAMPGSASLHAVTHPEGGDWFFFVARGDGGSEFSRTLKEHNRAVERYRRSKGAGK